MLLRLQGCTGRIHGTSVQRWQQQQRRRMGTRTAPHATTQRLWSLEPWHSTRLRWILRARSC